MFEINSNLFIQKALSSEYKSNAMRFFVTGDSVAKLLQMALLITMRFTHARDTPKTRHRYIAQARVTKAGHTINIKRIEMAFYMYHCNCACVSCGLNSNMYVIARGQPFSGVVGCTRTHTHTQNACAPFVCALGFRRCVLSRKTQR